LHFSPSAACRRPHDREFPILDRHEIDGASRSAYERLRRRALLARLRLAIGVGLLSLPAGAAMNVVAAPDRLAERLAGFAFLIGAYAGMLALTHWPGAIRRPRTLAVGFMLVLGGGLLYLLSLSPGDLDVLTAPVACVIVGSTFLCPWGTAAQVVVSGTIAVAYAGLVLPAGAPGMRAANVVTGLVVSAGLSIFGALVLERSRHAAFSERQRVRALAVQRRHLIEIGRDLRSTLDGDAIAARVVEHAARLIAADAVVLALRRGPTDRYRITATNGGPRFENLVGLEWSEAFSSALCNGFARAEVREVPGGPFDDFVGQPMRWLGVERALFAAVGPRPTPFGVLCWVRNATQPFARADRLAAQGIADQTWTALSAARLYEEASRASRLKTEFVSTMSHELRTPLNVIMGYNQILNETLPPDPETTHALDAVRRASNELLDLVEATLDLGRIETGRESVSEETTPVRDIFDELAREFAGVPRPPSVALVWDEGENPTITVDRRKLRTVLKNLAGNALKFTPAGSVRVECRRMGDRCRFRVIDTGIGIRPEDQAAVFEMFRQADSSDTRRYGGTGLGLYIVRRLVGLLGGEVTLESAIGRGSTFTVTVPLGGSSGNREQSAA
jgi:signal transduction histidine kinase